MIKRFGENIELTSLGESDIPLSYGLLALVNGCYDGDLIFPHLTISTYLTIRY